MRQIKFRAWDKENKEMFYPKSFDETMVIQLNGVIGLFNSDKEYDTVTNRFELMQFTGLQDCNGKDIYEGDLISWVFMGRLGGWYKVRFSEGIFCFEIYGNTYPIREYTEQEGFVIVGNIYETPDAKD